MRSTLLGISAFVALASGVAVLPSAAADVTSCGTWAELNSDQPVHWASAHLTVYDSARGRMLIFGGDDPGTANQVWATSLADPSTLEQIPTQGTVNAGAGAAGIYDPIRDRLVVFGGSAGTGSAYALSLSSSPATWSVIPDAAALALW